MIKRILDYKRRKALDEQARSLWMQAAYECIYNKDASLEEAVGKANTLVGHFYDAFYTKPS